MSKQKSKRVATSGKLLMWRCGKCGYNNSAPANQTPHNVVMCYECETLLEWHQVLKMQTPVASDSGTRVAPNAESSDLRD